MKDIARFLTGFKNFQRTYFCEDSDFFKSLKSSQNPNVLVVACSDSRVDPAILTGCAPGDMFVVRNVANLIPPYEKTPGLHGVSAAVEYSVKVLGVEHVIVLGHSCCGGIQALMTPEREGLGEFIAPWVSIAEPALAEVARELGDKPDHVRMKACEQAAVLVSLENLLTFPFVWERVMTGKLYLHGWYFDMEKGELLSYLPETGSFEPLVARCVRP
ncbi:Carbonic anhydrase 1 [Fundidesulfovibrio magnetotacticus]|uniref:Carbonic anhydrase n=1 Tax=Fundidesulfovibrio magnetotacticus TaxID=2730080 RepID=A0A6V8LXD5_9BACT|nr:carbonic anhydrase [Fundidesulfovibrio magnetotacticus]GFK95550.1 Carbonic anhydrase 1 [Fundidesulfovibrio magnetotacticus]